MRKNALTKVLALALCAVSAVPAVACGGGGGSGGVDWGDIDETKTQVYVYHYNAGYGQEWVKELKANFEAKYANVPFEEGKMGVEVLYNGDMNSRTAENWRSENYSVLFLESPGEFYLMMKQGVVEPLDTIMTTPNADDNNQTIEEKMTQQQRDAYSYGGHYYGIPHYAGHYGLIYNKDLFDKEGFYLAAEPVMTEETVEWLISEDNSTKSVGPDGVSGTTDDGLPRTYEEFFTLCAEIDAKGVDPICWPGMYYEQHITHLMDNLVAAAEGAEQMNLNYTFSGEATDLVVFDDDGNIVYNDDGTPKTESLMINDDNAYNLSRQVGKYYAMQFIAQLLEDETYYNEDDSTNKAVTHLEMQQKFLENGLRNKRESAMLVDGVWWQMEADATFSRLERSHGEEYSKESREFGWMPLPQPTEEEADKVANGEKKSVYLDYLRSVACVRANWDDGVKAASLEFLKYVYSDEALANFTYTTGTTIGVDYMDVIDRSKLTPYEVSLVDYIAQSDLVYQISGNEKYSTSFQSFGSVVNRYGCGTLAKNIYDAVLEEDMSAEEYFIGNQTIFKNSLW